MARSASPCGGTISVRKAHPAAQTACPTRRTLCCPELLELEILPRVLEHDTCRASVLVAVFNYEIEYMASRLLLDDLHEMLQQYENADAVLAVSGHALVEGRLPVVRGIEVPRQSEFYGFGEFLTHEAGKCVDELHTLRIRPSGKIASPPLELHSMK